jgi:hypothetical protein
MIPCVLVSNPETDHLPVAGSISEWRVILEQSAS